MNTATVVITDNAQPSTEKTEAIAAFMFELMAVSEKRGDPEVALNALLGAYINLAHKSGAVSVKKAAGALVSAGRAIAAAEDVQPSAETVEAASVPQPAREAITALIGKVNAQLAGQRHEVALSALMSLFRNAALQFTCCTESSGHNCIALGMELLASTATGHRVPGTSVH